MSTERRPALDLFRIILCLMVVCEHYLSPPRPSGAIAVLGFCVMSGFWVAELFEKSQFDVIRFYTNKAKRLLPLLVVAILWGVVWACVIYRSSESPYFWNVFTHDNFTLIKIMYFYDVPAWYMNSEFMFLLLVPFFYVLYRKSVWCYAAVFAFLFIVVWALYAPIPWDSPRGGGFGVGLYYSPLARLWQFMAGVFAYRLVHCAWLVSWRPVLWTVFGAGAIISAFFITQPGGHYFEDSFAFQVAGIAFYCLLVPSLHDVHCKHANWNRLLAYGAGLTYGIYLFHWQTLAVVRKAANFCGLTGGGINNAFVLCVAFGAAVVVTIVLNRLCKRIGLPG